MSSRRQVRRAAGAIAAERHVPREAAAVRIDVRDPAGERVVHGRRGVGPGSRLQPFAFGEAGRHRAVLIVDDAGRRHVERGDLHHDVRLAHRPFRRRLGGVRQRILAFAARSAGLDPVDDRLHLRVGQAHVVGPHRAVVVGVVRRHALGAQHFADHRREALARRRSCSSRTDRCRPACGRRRTCRRGSARPRVA